MKDGAVEGWMKIRMKRIKDLIAEMISNKYINDMSNDKLSKIMKDYMIII